MTFVDQSNNGKWYESFGRVSTTKLTSKCLLGIITLKSQIDNFNEGSTQSCLVATRLTINAEGG